MKIERLYKLSQFVDFTKEIEQKENETYTKFIATKLGLIIRYNERLKQPLTKEMFVNNESKDWFNKDGSINVKIQLKWMDAEKKVILEGFSKRKCDHGVMYDNEDLDIFIEENEFKFLYEIAECFDGKLKTKNFEI